MKKIFSTIVILLMTISVVEMVQGNVFSYSHPTNVTVQLEESKEKDIADTLSGDARFKTFVNALKSADLLDSLKEKGPFTVFAPTEEAFAKLPSGKLSELLKPENKENLESILFYHVSPEKLKGTDVAKLNNKEITMVNGDNALITIKNGEAFIDGAKIIVTDIITKNGIIHVIDTVMLPR